MKQKIQKIQGHTDQLLGCYLGLKKKYALLKPMLEDRKVQEIFGSGAKRDGFETILYALRIHPPKLAHV